MTMDRDIPELAIDSPAGLVDSVVIVLPGGRERGVRRVRRWNLAVLRMQPFVRTIRRHAPHSAIVLVRYRHRGWNRADPVDDVAYACSVIEDRFAGVPIVLVGHSMGGRTALRSAGLEHVEGLVGLAPWIPDGEPYEQLAACRVVLLHGANDHTTSPDATARCAMQSASVAREVVSLRLARTGHTMLRRARTWHRLIGEFVAAILAGSSITDIGAGEPGISSTARPDPRSGT